MLNGRVHLSNVGGAVYNHGGSVHWVDLYDTSGRDFLTFHFSTDAGQARAMSNFINHELLGLPTDDFMQHQANVMVQENSDTAEDRMRDKYGSDPRIWGAVHRAKRELLLEA